MLFRTVLRRLSMRVLLAVVRVIAVIGMVTMALEKLAGFLPLVFFAGIREHRGDGEEGGSYLGLHVGTGE